MDSVTIQEKGGLIHRKSHFKFWTWKGNMEDYGRKPPQILGQGETMSLENTTLIARFGEVLKQDKSDEIVGTGEQWIWLTSPTMEQTHQWGWCDILYYFVNNNGCFLSRRSSKIGEYEKQLGTTSFTKHMISLVKFISGFSKFWCLWLKHSSFLCSSNDGISPTYIMLSVMFLWFCEGFWIYNTSPFHEKLKFEVLRWQTFVTFLPKDFLKVPINCTN